VSLDYRAKPGDQDLVGNMTAVPGQQEIHPVNSRDGDVECVRSCVPRQTARCQKMLGQRVTLRRHLQGLDLLCQRYTKLRKFLITFRNLQQHDARDEQVEARSFFKPPLFGFLLACRDGRIAAGLGGHVTDDAGLDIDLGLQSPSSGNSLPYRFLEERLYRFETRLQSPGISPRLTIAEPLGIVVLVVVDLAGQLKDLPLFTDLNILLEGCGYRFLPRPVISDSDSFLDQRVVES
jgi:hypothetical protein